MNITVTGSKSTLTLDRGLHASAEQHHTALIGKRLNAWYCRVFYVICHKACILQLVLKCMRMHHAHGVTFSSREHARISCMRRNIKSWCKRYITIIDEQRALTDGSVAQDGDLARFRLRHLYLFPTTSISTCKRAWAVWKKRNHMDLIRYCVTA